MNTDVPILQLKNVDFGFKDTSLFKNLSLTVHSKEFIGVLGPNGSGKSTLIKLMGGLLKPQSGCIKLKGMDINTLTARKRARTIALVPQQTTIYHPFTVREIVMMGRYPHSPIIGFESDEDLLICEEAMKIAGISHLASRQFDHISGGEKQRAVLGSAIAQKPELLLLDEPTASLDIRFQLVILDVIKWLNSKENITVIAAVHDLNLASRFFDRIVMIDNEHVVISGKTDDILTLENIERIFGVMVKEIPMNIPNRNYYIPDLKELDKRSGI
ncbi:ABC transporter ATP-binding protein [bacterium]|nr:ABC transporter ATP-binding protein [candidate division CSSED10-310 bacterium]